MSSPPPCITYRVIHAESSGVITEEGIHASYSTCRGLGNNSIIHLHRFNHHMNKNNREVRTCYISTTNCLLWALLIALKYRQLGKRDIVLVIIDIDKALECGDIIFHAKDLGRSFGHADCTKWVWEYLFHNRISWQGVVCGVSLNDILDRGLFEIFPAFSKITASTRLEQLRGNITLDFFLMRKQQCHQTFNLETGSWDWREWYDIGRKCGEFASCFRLPPNKDPIYPVWLAQEAVNWKGLLVPHILQTQPESLEEFRDGQFLYIAKRYEPFN
jgi:hypothetical protein